MTEQLRPEEGSYWRHRNGALYEVLFIANEPDDDRYPETVVYRSVASLKIWARPLSDWHRSMTLCNFNGEADQ